MLRLVAKIPREPFKFWDPSTDTDDASALEGMVAIPCQGTFLVLNLRTVADFTPQDAEVCLI